LARIVNFDKTDRIIFSYTSGSRQSQEKLSRRPEQERAFTQENSHPFQDGQELTNWRDRAGFRTFPHPSGKEYFPK
jgi:hypothetical protein